MGSSEQMMHNDLLCGFIKRGDARGEMRATLQRVAKDVEGVAQLVHFADYLPESDQTIIELRAGAEGIAAAFRQAEDWYEQDRRNVLFRNLAGPAQFGEFEGEGYLLWPEQGGQPEGEIRLSEEAMDVMSLDRSRTEWAFKGGAYSGSRTGYIEATVLVSSYHFADPGVHATIIGVGTLKRP